MKKILVHHHLGLGDHFVCNGLVRELLQRENADILYLPTKKHNFSTVSSMYLDDNRIVCVPIEDNKDVYGLSELKNIKRFYRVGFEYCQENNWDVSFYESVKLPFNIRWDKWKCHRNLDKEKQLESVLKIKEPYVLIHDTGSIGKYELNINTNYRIIKIEPITDCLLDWYGIIEKAHEVHCIDSSVIHIAQSIRDEGIFHNIRKIYEYEFKLKSNWTICDYHKIVGQYSN